jgi:hypothetical protein
MIVAMRVRSTMPAISSGAMLLSTGIGPDRRHRVIVARVKVDGHEV